MSAQMIDNETAWVRHRYDALQTEKISSEKRRRLGLPLGKRSVPSTFPKTENPHGQ